MGSSEGLDATNTLDERLNAKASVTRPDRTKSMPAGLHPGMNAGAKEHPVGVERVVSRPRRVSDAVRERVPILNRVSERVLVMLAVGALVWLIAVTVALSWVLLAQTAMPEEAPDETAALVEKIHERGRAMQRKLLRIPLLSAMYVVLAPYTGVLMGLAGPQVRLAFRWLNNIIPTLRKAQGFYVVVFWFNKIKQAQLLTMLSTAIRSTWLKAGDSVKACVQPGDAAVTVATGGRAL